MLLCSSSTWYSKLCLYGLTHTSSCLNWSKEGTCHHFWRHGAWRQSKYDCLPYSGLDDKYDSCGITPWHDLTSDRMLCHLPVNYFLAKDSITSCRRRTTLCNCTDHRIGNRLSIDTWLASRLHLLSGKSARIIERSVTIFEDAFISLTVILALTVELGFERLITAELEPSCPITETVYLTSWINAPRRTHVGGGSLSACDHYTTIWLLLVNICLHHYLQWKHNRIIRET